MNRKTMISIDEMMKQALEIPGLLSLAAGFTDNNIMPRADIREVVGEMFEDDTNNDVLQYGDPSGRPGLRKLIAERVTEQDRMWLPGSEPVDPEHVVITNGSQQALFLSMIALCRPGDAVLVESPTYFVFLDLLRTLGIHAIPMPARDSTLYVEEMPKLLARLRDEGTLPSVKAVYLVSYFANPSAQSLTWRQKEALVQAMNEAELHVPVIEDIAYREFYFDEPWPAATVRSLCDRRTQAYVTGTLTKIFATGTKVGYAVIPEPTLRRRILDLKRCADFGTANLNQAVLERAIGEGRLDNFLNHMRPLYRDKCNALDDALREHGLDQLGWTWRRSAGSLYLWLCAPSGVVTSADSPLHKACIEEKVIYVPGDLCFAEGGDDRVRLSFGSLGHDDLREAAARFVRAARRINEQLTQP